MIKDKWWTSAIDIKENDYIELSNGSYEKILEVEYRENTYPIKVYNLTVEDNHNYYIDKYAELVNSNKVWNWVEDIPDRLIDMSVDLDLKEKKLNNSSLWCLCQEVLKKRTEDGISLIIKCLNKKPDVKSLNSAGYSVENLINERGTDEMKKVMEEIIYE